MFFFVTFTCNQAGWLILLPPGIGWDIMGYESEPLPSYISLSNFSYSIMLNYTYYISTPQVHFSNHMHSVVCNHSKMLTGCQETTIRI